MSSSASEPAGPYDFVLATRSMSMVMRRDLAEARREMAVRSGPERRNQHLMVAGPDGINLIYRDGYRVMLTFDRESRNWFAVTLKYTDLPVHHYAKVSTSDYWLIHDADVWA